MVAGQELVGTAIPGAASWTRGSALEEAALAIVLILGEVLEATRAPSSVRQRAMSAR